MKPPTRRPGDPDIENLGFFGSETGPRIGLQIENTPGLGGIDYRHTTRPEQRIELNSDRCRRPE